VQKEKKKWGKREEGNESKMREKRREREQWE